MTRQRRIVSYEMRHPEANAQVNLLTAMSCSQVTDENSASIHAQYESVLTTVSTDYTPEKGQSNSDVRPTEKVNLI
jgi:hypothetical protein